MTDLRVKDSRVIISGGGSGIGLAVAAEFLAEGAKVGIISRTEQTVERSLTGALTGFDGRVFASVADVSGENSLAEAVRELTTRLGGLDHVVASAGVEGEMGASLEEA
jgi:dihydroanticapsin dehydrogenase